MYSRDQPIISAYARARPDNLARVIQFVLLTIRKPLFNIGADIEEVERGEGDPRSILFGSKFAGWIHAAEHAESHLRHCNWVMEGDLSERGKTEMIIERFAMCPGIGIVKAGFIAQLAYGLGGCLDTHNLKMYGISPAAFNGVKKLRRAKSRHKKIALYARVCADLGGPETLWDNWCRYVADNQPRYYKDASAVSRTHVEAILDTDLNWNGA